MILRRLRLEHVRNHRLSDFECPAGITVLWGENGAGKTTILEGVSLLCTTRSFVSPLDRTLVQAGTDGFGVAGEFRTDTGSVRTVAVRYADTARPGSHRRKEIALDNAAVRTSADIIGLFPIVTLAPHHRDITAGAPAERRSFIDFLLSQIHRRYLVDLIAYRRVVRHRNAVLADQQAAPAPVRNLLEPWDEALAQLAVRIARERRVFLDRFAPYVTQAMEAISAEQETIELAYAPASNIEYFAPDAVAAFRTGLAEAFPRERRTGSTSLGPHRDDLHFRLNGLDTRLHASQGQHKSILISLKLAECRYLAEHVEERPLLLLDDVFSELDDERLHVVLSLLGGFGQTFLTTASRHILEVLPGLGGCATFHVEQGRVTAIREAA